jgi:sugar lactone lactonase YvrE
VASDGAGNLFVADSSDHTIRQIVIATGVVTTLAGSAGNTGSTDGTGTAARFNNPTGLASDGAGNLFVADSSNNTIRQIDVATGVVTTLAGSASNAGSADGTGDSARFYYPGGLATDGAGNLYVAEYPNHTVRKIVVATRAVTTVIGSPDRRGVALGPLPASLNGPTALAVGPAGVLFIADGNEDSVLAAHF